ncbi:MAG: hypothetical protein MJ078_06875, partial [Clostridia bacterium]|nr:hypothetical protein [Clostridia bacterium]
MLYSVGYQMRQDTEWMETIVRNKAFLKEVYFSFGDIPNGRNSQWSCSGFLPHEAQEKQLADLSFLAENGIPLNLLYNGNCYGENAQSRAFFRQIGDTVDYFAARFGLRSVTTTSPLIGRFVKENFRGLD